MTASNIAKFKIQGGKALDGEVKISGSEDCLNLDVYAPAEAENLPVMVYVHGGNNQTGKSSEIVGSEIVIDQNCVYVTLN